MEWKCNNCGATDILDEHGHSKLKNFTIEINPFEGDVIITCEKCGNSLTFVEDCECDEEDEYDDMGSR